MNSSSFPVGFPMNRLVDDLLSWFGAEKLRRIQVYGHDGCREPVDPVETSTVEGGCGDFEVPGDGVRFPLMQTLSICSQLRMGRALLHGD